MLRRVLGYRPIHSAGCWSSRELPIFDLWSLAKAELAANRTLKEGPTASVDAKVFDNAGAAKNLLSFQTSLIDKNGD